MGEPQLHKILIGLALSVIIITSITLLYTHAAVEYSLTDYDNESFEGYEKNLEELYNITNQTKERIESVQANPLIPDALGVIAVGGIGAGKTAVKSVDLFGNVAGSMMNLLPIGPIGSLVVTVLLTILFIVFFIGILLHFINKSNRT